MINDQGNIIEKLTDLLKQLPANKKDDFGNIGFDNIPMYIPMISPCQGCSNHPSNGGSGICLCTLGGSQVIC